MLKLWCAGRLAYCPSDVKRFRFTCLFCRWRRSYLGKYKVPPEYVKYTYKSLYREVLVKEYITRFGSPIRMQAANGGCLKIKQYYYVLIDPGRFLMLRCSIIRVLDAVMGYLKRGRPFVEFCEFFANYPN